MIRFTLTRISARALLVQACGEFRFVRNLMLCGALLIYAPLLIGGYYAFGTLRVYTPILTTPRPLIRYVKRSGTYNMEEAAPLSCGGGTPQSPCGTNYQPRLRATAFAPPPHSLRIPHYFAHNSLCLFWSFDTLRQAKVTTTTPNGCFSRVLIIKGSSPVNSGARV